MNPPKSTLFISDLHLDSQHPEITDTFFYFLEHIAPDAKALYILGDLFEVYIGDDDNSPFMQSITDKLAQFTKTGPPTYVMHGNRDFLIRKKFAKKTGVILIPDPTVITPNNQKILLMHGDSLCTLDIAHQRSRRYSHNWLVQTLCLLLPLKVRKHVATKLRIKSSASNQTKTSDIMDVTQSAVEAEMQIHQSKLAERAHTRL